MSKQCQLQCSLCLQVTSRLRHAMITAHVELFDSEGNITVEDVRAHMHTRMPHLAPSRLQERSMTNPHFFLQAAEQYVQAISSCSSSYLQAMGDNRAMEYMRGRRTLEINPDHPVISSLKGRFDEHGDSDSNAQAMTELLYETSLLTSGFSVDSPKDFAKRCAASCILPSACCFLVIWNHNRPM
jgi:HSP90 family molecular chaperone